MAIVNSRAPPYGLNYLCTNDRWTYHNVYTKRAATTIDIVGRGWRFTGARRFQVWFPFLRSQDALKFRQRTGTIRTYGWRRANAHIEGWTLSLSACETKFCGSFDLLCASFALLVHFFCGSFGDIISYTKMALLTVFQHYSFVFCVVLDCRRLHVPAKHLQSWVHLKPIGISTATNTSKH